MRSAKLVLKSFRIQRKWSTKKPLLFQLSISELWCWEGGRSGDWRRHGGAQPQLERTPPPTGRGHQAGCLSWDVCHWWWGGWAMTHNALLLRYMYLYAKCEGRVNIHWPHSRIQWYVISNAPWWIISLPKMWGTQRIVSFQKTKMNNSWRGFRRWYIAITKMKTRSCTCFWYIKNEIDGRKAIMKERIWNCSCVWMCWALKHQLVADAMPDGNVGDCIVQEKFIITQKNNIEELCTTKVRS